MKINTFDLLKDNNLVQVKINDFFKWHIQDKIKEKFGSLNKYNTQKLKIYFITLKKEFYFNKYFKFSRLLDITKDLNISKEETYANISTFIAHGTNTRKEIFLQRKLNIDEFFVEGYALYLAEGDNGSNGKTTPRKVRLTNSELPVIKQFMAWIQKYFPNNEFYLKIHTPQHKELSKEFIEQIRTYLSLNKSQIKIRKEEFRRNTGTFFRLCLDSAVLIDLLLAMEKPIKNLILQDEKLMRAYIRGMMIGEGTAYCNKIKYVRIEMRNEQEIKFLKELFNHLDFDVKAKERGTRKDIWYIYVGTLLLKKYNELIGFGIHNKRQKLLEKAIAEMEKKIKK